VDASSNPQALENVGGGLVQPTNMFPAWVEVSGVFRLDAAAFARGPGAPFTDKDQFDKNDATGLDLGRGVVFVTDDADNRADEHGAPDSDGSRRYPYDVQVNNLLASIHESIRALLKYSSVSMSRAELSNRSLTSGPDHAGSR
jgi:hypothetical protein